MNYAILVTGSNSWSDYDTMYRIMSKYDQGTVVIHGDTLGADLYADEIAYRLNFRRILVPIYNWMGLECESHVQLMVTTLIGMQELGYSTECYFFTDNRRHLTKSKAYQDLRKASIDPKVYDEAGARACVAHKKAL